MKSAMSTTWIRHLKLNKISWFFITVVYMIVLIYVSTKPAAEGHTPSTAEQVAHNLCHIPAYAILFYFLMHCFTAFNFVAQTSSFVVTVVFGAVNEWLQSFIPSRTASVSDIMLNAVGAGLMLWLMINQYKKDNEARA